MSAELMESAGKVGLDIHWGKTSILNNISQEDRREMTNMRVLGQIVKVIPYNSSTMCFGRALSFGRLHDAELENRSNRERFKFDAHKQELCGKHYPLQDCLRMFEAVVTPTISYSAGAWTLYVSRKKVFLTAQR